MTRLGRSYPFFLLPLLSAVRAQFYWSFPSQNDSNSLSSCESIPVTVWENPGASGVSPPFWVYSYPTKGVPSVQLLEGEGLVNLTYEVRYPQGTELIISVYDSNNHNGGWGRAYTIQSGSTGCLPSTDTPIHVSLNTSQADTCDSVLFSISGGTPPYTVNVIPDTSTNTVAPTTNDTLPASDAYYSWVADVTSGSGMLVGVRDLLRDPGADRHRRAESDGMCYAESVICQPAWFWRFKQWERRRELNPSRSHSRWCRWRRRSGHHPSSPRSLSLQTSPGLSSHSVRCCRHAFQIKEK
ncbi:hypothetical protein BT69DRAFT_488928 [Atractiella rhizophila]|nr:hypothetical protein BT69DRAFT_488928 [Atractiella rhizophila]